MQVTNNVNVCKNINYAAFEDLVGTWRNRQLVCYDPHEAEAAPACTDREGAAD